MLPITSLPKELKPVWKVDIGGGFAAPVVQGSALIYVDENGSREFAHRIDAATGKEVWKIDYAKMESDEWGAGPRASQFLILAAKARAILDGRFAVSTDDVAALARPTLQHRLILNYRAEAEGQRPGELVDRLLSVVTP